MKHYKFFFDINKEEKWRHIFNFVNGDGSLNNKEEEKPRYIYIYACGILESFKRKFLFKKMGRSARRDVAKPKGNEAFNMSFAISFVFLWPKVSPTTPLLLELGFHPKARKFQLV